MSSDKNVLVQGRLVWICGDLFKGDLARNYSDKTPKLSKKTGQQYQEYGFGLAVPKAHCAEVWNAMHAVAQSCFPNGPIPANFHMKFKDGDTGTNQDGSPVNTKEGYPGCIVLTIKTSGFPIKFFKFEGGNNTQVSDGIKCGDYVEVQLNIDSHTGVNAGLYLNPMAVRFLQAGKEIVNTPSADQVFGAAAPAMPSWLPPPPAAAAMPNYGQAPQAFAPPAAAPAAPHYGVLPPVHQPTTAPGQYAPPPMPR